MVIGDSLEFGTKEKTLQEKLIKNYNKSKILLNTITEYIIDTQPEYVISTIKNIKELYSANNLVLSEDLEKRINQVLKKFIKKYGNPESFKGNAL